MIEEISLKDCLGPRRQLYLNPEMVLTKFMHLWPCLEKKASSAGISIGKQLGWTGPGPLPSQHLGVFPVRGSLVSELSVMSWSRNCPHATKRMVTAWSWKPSSVWTARDTKRGVGKGCPVTDALIGRKEMKVIRLLKRFGNSSQITLVHWFHQHSQVPWIGDARSWQRPNGDARCCCKHQWSNGNAQLRIWASSGRVDSSLQWQSWWCQWGASHWQWHPCSVHTAWPSSE